MDLLLRRLGLRDDATVSNVVGDHLDADELSAYAENALPAPARARYTAHLAECARCRELVVQLGASVGVVSALETPKVSAPSVLRKLFASLFTPMVLRYAAPALGLIVVAAIGFIVVRRDQRGSPDYVTQATQNEQRPAAQSAAETAAADNESASKTAPSPEGFRDRQKSTLHAESGPAPPPNAAPVVGSIQTEVSKDAAAAQPKADQKQQTSANEPPAPKPVATPGETVRAAEAEAKTAAVQSAPAAAAPAAERTQRAQQREDRKTGDFSSTANKKAEPTDSVRTAGAGSVARLQTGRDDNKAQSGETRSVAGRRFRKQGSVWIDTAYDASKDPMTLTRGSERYRAIIADEPELKRIADELDGEIIVVWKGRAYRIR